MLRRRAVLKMTAAVPATAVAKLGRSEIVIQTRHTFVALWRHNMYRIHFTANGALRTERAVLEISPAGIRWRFKPGEGLGEPPSSRITAPQADGAVSSRQFKPMSHGNSLVVRDYAYRWPAYQRRRMVRRWKAGLVEMATLISNDLRERFDAAALRLIARFESEAPEAANNSAALDVVADPAPSPALPMLAVLVESE